MSTVLLTTYGLAKLASATPESQLKIAHVAVGDGAGGFPTLTPSMTSLTNEVWRGTASAPIREPGFETVVKFEAIIPPEDGGFSIREMAIFDDLGGMVAIAHTALIEKPSALGTTAVTMTVTMRLTLANAAQVDLVINDTPYIDHEAIENRDKAGCHPRRAIDGLVGVQSSEGATLLPNQLVGTTKLLAGWEWVDFWLPSAASTIATEVTLVLDENSGGRARIRPPSGTAFYCAEDLLDESGWILLQGHGDWVTLRNIPQTGRWHVTAASTFRRDPTETTRGMPLAATADDARLGTGAGMVTPPTLFAALAEAKLGVMKKSVEGLPCIIKTAAGAASIRAGTAVQIGDFRRIFWTDTAITMPTLTAGQDYSVWAKPDGSVVAVADPYSAPAAAPDVGAVKIGGFHYGLVAPSTTVSGGSFATAAPSMVWTATDVNRIAGINEFSIWDLTYRPACDPRGMTCVKTSDGRPLFWFDIYLCGQNHIVDGTSRYNTNVASSTVPPRVPLMFGGNGTANYTGFGWFDGNEVAFSHGKRLMSYQEFAAAAFGVTENQSWGGTGTIPATKREPSYTSKWGGEQMTGHHWVFGSVAHADAGTVWVDGAMRGQTYGEPVRAVFGGARGVAASSGSRCSKWDTSAWYSHWGLGLRAACDHLHL